MNSTIPHIKNLKQYILKFLEIETSKLVNVPKSPKLDNDFESDDNVDNDNDVDS